jgi:hypothetical protein
MTTIIAVNHKSLLSFLRTFPEPLYAAAEVRPAMAFSGPLASDPTLSGSCTIGLDCCRGSTVAPQEEQTREPKYRADPQLLQ